MALPSCSHFCSTANPRNSLHGKMWRYYRSVLFKVIEIGTNRKPICDFLLVFHCNYMPIFYRFRYTTVYWQKIFFVVFTHGSLAWSLSVARSPGIHNMKVGNKKYRVPGLPEGENLTLWPDEYSQGTSLWRTYRQTDRQTDRGIAEREKNWQCEYVS